ncbi:MAG: exopolysaccharide biosynthesis polyprenyl glycosylphosphotransferase [Hyphomicrobiaceae bacterium]|jgi:exopolysaccharide biosynthesis polyprenyl glycosylphosphotransferase
MSRSPRRLTTTTAELLCILAALSCAGLWTGSGENALSSTLIEAMGLWLVFGVIWLLIGRRIGVNLVSPRRNLAVSLRRTTEAWAATWGIGGMLTITVIQPSNLSIWLVLLAGLGFLTFWRLASSFSSTGIPAQQLRAIVIGSCPSARALSSTKDITEAFDFVGFVPFANEPPQNMPHLTHLGDVSTLPETLRRNEIDIAFVSPSDDAITGEVHQSIDTCEGLGLQTQYFPSFLDVDDMSVGMTWSANRPGLNVQAMADSSLASIGKRAIDITGALIGILLLLPVIIACALAVKLTSRGPILYRQTRIGKSGRSFGCLKFRTMRVGAHAQQELLRASSQQDGPAFKIAGDPRITPIGRMLRKFSIDELPQLLNVLLGDMSLVGPRPPIPSEVDKYTWWQRRRISVKPGLTCVWQVYGRNRVSFKRWVEMDLYYIDNRSLWLDFKLIAHTVRVVLGGTGM